MHRNCGNEKKEEDSVLRRVPSRPAWTSGRIRISLVFLGRATSTAHRFVLPRLQLIVFVMNMTGEEEESCYSHMHPTKRASKADGIKLGCALVPGPRLKTFMSKGSSLPAALASNSRFSIPVAWSIGSLITKTGKGRKREIRKLINRKKIQAMISGVKKVIEEFSVSIFLL